LAAAGLHDPAQLLPDHILRRVSPTDIASYATLYPTLQAGELLTGVPDHPVFQRYWARARADSFALG